MAVTDPLLLADADRYYLFLSREPDAGRSGRQHVRVLDDPVAAGQRAGLRLRPGHRQAAVVPTRLFENQMMLLEQFAELPVHRRRRPGDRPDDQAVPVPVVVLDKELGKLRYNKGHVAATGFFMSVTVRPEDPGGRVLPLRPPAADRPRRRARRPADDRYPA